MSTHLRLGLFVLGAMATASTACGSDKRTDVADASVAAPAALAPANVLLSLRNESARTGFQRVVRGDGRLSRDGAGFVAAFDVKPTVAVRLPSKATEPFELRHGAMSLRVAMLGAKPVEGRIEDDGVVYPDAIDGALLAHVPTPRGTEEFLRYEVAPKERRVSYLLSLEGVAGLRLVDREVLEFLEASGNPVLRTTAPWIIDADGQQRRGALELQGCAYDSSAAMPWDRPVTKPGGQTCTVHVTWDDDGMRYPLLVDPPWTDTGALATKRYQHSASRISGSGVAACASGCVLVAGGINGRLGTGTVLASGELYNVASGTWGSAGSSGYVRRMHAQVDLGGGSAVAIGGATTNSASTPTATTAVTQYNTTAGWSILTAMPAARYGHAALRAGGVTFVSGGYASGGVIPQSTLYSFNGTAWSTLTAMTSARAEHVMPFHGTGTTIFCDGFLVAGGIGTGGTALNTLQHYGVAVASGCASAGWHAVTGTMSGVRSKFAAAFINSGTLLVGGGTSAIDIVTGSTSLSVAPWGTRTTSSNQNLTATRLAASNRVLVAGGEPTFSMGASATAAILDGNAATAGAITNMKYQRAGHTATDLPNGSVLLAGGASCSSFGCTFPTTDELFQIGAKGTGCGFTAECASGLTCVDGVCCDTACGSKCQACNEPGSLGTCKTISGVPRGTRAACPTPNTGLCGYTCNGADPAACVAAGSSTECGAATCVSGVATPAAKCDGAGSCGAVASTSCGKFACNTAGTACLSAPCATNADCATGYRCDSGSKDCVPTGAAGSPCVITTDCSSGLTCVDSVCCTSSSCASPQKCNIPGSSGSCKLPYGTACTTTTALDCPTGQCVDGVCCDTACTGQCEACNQTGKVGSCKPVPAGGKPVGARTACTGTGACQASCDGSTTVNCGPAPGPTVVCAIAACTAGSETPTRFCNGAGGCTPASSTNCAPYVCGPSACKDVCDTNADCLSTYFCAPDKLCKGTGADGTRCLADDECTSKFCIDGVCCKTSTCSAGQRCDATTTGTCALPIAATCTSGTECGSGYCVDGVCCTNACLGQCEACNVGGAIGTCSPIVGAPRTGKPACSGSGDCQAKCDGSDTTKCGAPPGTSTVCAPESCTGTAYTGISQCNGAGACATPSPSACTPYVCGTTKCKTSCFTSTDCASGYACKDGLCVTTGALGTVCTDPTQCASGNCVAGSAGKSVCCSVAMCATGSVCADDTAGDRRGTCVKPRGGTCTTKDECASGFCVDGVCCDAACSGQCEACDVPGAEGTCSAVNGAPRGTRAACFDGAGDVCKALACEGGKDRTKCGTFKNSVETECAPAKCEVSKESPASRCDGMGECKAGTPKDCGLYVCGDKACKTSCAAPTDCSPGNVCADGKCVPSTAKCDDTGTKSVPLDGSAPRDCAPFRCSVATGDCLNTCTASTDCVSGAVCDGTKCVTAAAPGGDSGDSGGCAVGSPRSSGGTGGAVLLMLGALGLASRLARRRAA